MELGATESKIFVSKPRLILARAAHPRAARHRVKREHPVLALRRSNAKSLEYKSVLLAVRPLRFAITSPPSGCEEDFHLPAVKHARHTTNRPGRVDRPGLLLLYSIVPAAGLNFLPGNGKGRDPKKAVTMGAKNQ